MKYIKKFYLLLLLIITLSSLIMYGTYAMFSSSIESNIVNMDTNIVYKFKINGTQELKVSAGSKLRFNAVVENDMEGKISYGLYYKMISPSTLPSGAIIAQVSDDLTVLAKGQLDSGASKTVPIVIKNTSESEITVEIGVRTGYATDSQGVDDIIYNDGEIPITSFQTSEEAGNDSCTSTMKCTEECESREVNGEWKIFCVCNMEEKGSPTISGAELITKIKSQSKGTMSSITNVATTNEGIYTTTDNYGTTYFFRGNIVNNYIKFAGFYWRIVRINGNDTIRIVYDGTVAHANGESSTDRQIGKEKFNYIGTDNAYFGYMYGKSDSSNYNATHTNTYNSTIKTYVDNWYKNNIATKEYKNKIADVIYCNDRQLHYGTGYGTNNSQYSPFSRIFTSSYDYANTQKIELTCSQKNDRFTVSDTTNGNGALTYPVGLLTVDEILAAGGKGDIQNTNYYLYTGQLYWTMSPSYYSATGAREFIVKNNGGISFMYSESGATGVKPVISLINDITLTGTGTINDPYVVQTLK